MANDSDFAVLWEEAKTTFEKASGKEVYGLPMPRSTEELVSQVNAKNKDYKRYTNGPIINFQQGMLFTILDAAVKPIELVGNLAAGAAGAVFPPSSMCFGAAMYLINAARGVSASLDAIMELLGTLKDFTVRLNVYTREKLSKELREKLVEILITVVEILARSSRVIKEGRIVNAMKMFSKNVLLGNDQKMQGLMGKLDKLTSSESRLVGAETLVETKKTSRNIEAVQVSMTENTAQLSTLNMTTNETAQGMTQVLSILEEQKAQAKEDKDLKHLDTVKKILKHSTAAQDRFDEIKREHVPGSGDWIYNEPYLQAWMDTKSPILWVSGNPGSGKSFLTYNMITKLQERHQDQSGQAGHDSIGYFFFRDNKDQTRSFSQALRDIAYQIAQTDQLYAKHVASHSDDEVMSIRSAWKRLFADFYLENDEIESSTYILLDGIDESFEEDRRIFFDLLKDVEAAGSDSRLRVAMIGRPQIIDEIMDQLEQDVPTIHVDSTKNGADIAHYVESSIAKSRVLKGVSKALKEEIVSTLSSRAGGMFMWCKLMIAELNKKTREPAIREALNKAPRGLNAMLEHVLEGFSSTLVQDEADDLNDMLLWVALAKRPLALGEVDAMLRLKSSEGYGVLNLEGMLRERFASFFTLTREDRLTTAELQAPQKLVGEDDEDKEEDEDTVGGVDMADGVDDVENATKYDSNPVTTTISFAHASISDFFRDPKQGKVTAKGEDHPAVGVDVKVARIKVARINLDLLVDETLKDRMKDAVSLTPYATYNWIEHLKEVERDCMTAEDKIEIANNLVKMLQEEPLLRQWIATRNYTFFTADNGKILLPYLMDETLKETIPVSFVAWVQSKAESPSEVFEPAIKYQAKMWLTPIPPDTWNLNACCTIVFSYLQRLKGETIENVPTMSVEQIVSTAEWAGFEQTAEWHRRVAIVVREKNWHDAAIERFQKAIELDNSMWIARVGITRVYWAQNKFKEALDMDLETLKIAEKDEKMDGSIKQAHIQTVVKRTGQCYESLVNDSQPLTERVRLLTCAFERYKQAFSMRNSDYEAVWWAFSVMWDLIKLVRDEEHMGRQKDESTKHTDNVELPSAHECYDKIFELVHDMSDTQKDDEHTHLVACLHQNKYEDDFFVLLALAAKDLDQLEWLQGRYRDAIASATKDRLTVTAACLSLCLAQLYCQYGDGENEEKAVRIWENLGTQGSASTKEATDIAYARTRALNGLGMYCMRRALEDEARAARWISKMERIVSKKKYGARLGAEDTVPPNDMAFYLAAWHIKHDRTEEARELLKPHVKDALVILSDDDPSNDAEGFLALGSVFLVMKDDLNAVAVYHSLRLYNADGEAVLASDDKNKEEKDDQTRERDGGVEDVTLKGGEKISASNREHNDAAELEDGTETVEYEEAKKEGKIENGEGEDNADKNGDDKDDNDNEDDDDDDDDDEDVGGCDGSCGIYFSRWDEVRWCRHCGYSFEERCFTRLQNGELPLRICGAEHEFMQVPILTQRFKKGEMLVGDKVITVDEWKAGIKKDWGL